ncbi:MAG: helix-turn-helix domain-containing protein [Steroidobacteraceae bacterium]
MSTPQRPSALPCPTCRARRGAVCHAWPDDAIGRLYAAARPERIAAGEWIVRPESASNETFMLREGLVHISRFAQDGKRQILAFLFPGDFFGFTAEERYRFGAFAVEDVHVCRFQRSELKAVTLYTPDAAFSVQRFMARIIDGQNELVFTLGRKTAIERVASFIWYLDYRQRKLGHAAGPVRVPMSRLDIADFLGLTSESVSRAFTQLKRDGVIRLPDPLHIEVPDMPRLREVAIVPDDPAPVEPPTATR